MIWILERFAYLPAGTLGKLTIPDGPTVYTIERPWKGNEPFVSCIPEDLYALEWDTTGRITNVPRLRYVPGRSQINIHPANYAHQLQGCIAPGLRWRVDAQEPQVVESQKAMELLAEHYAPPSDEDGVWLYDPASGDPISLSITGKIL